MNADTTSSADAASTRTRVFIYGSCVSRDTFEYLPQDRFSLVKYIARQSLISVFSQGPELDLSVIDSPFQRRMLEGDASGNLQQLLAEAAPVTDLLLWDLTDERLGVLRAQDGGFLTRTVESIRAGILDGRDDLTLVDFGSDEHFHLWRDALDRFVSLLESSELAERTLVLGVPWAERLADGEAAPKSFGTSPVQANVRYERYYRAIAEETALTVLGLPTTQVQGDPVHPWGAAPFHYTDELYVELSRRICAHAEGVGVKPGTAQHQGPDREGDRCS